MLTKKLETSLSWAEIIEMHYSKSFRIERI